MSASPAKKLLLGSLAGLAVMVAALAPASAHGKHRHHLRWYGPAIVTYSGGGGCSYYYWKWQNTGLRFWKHKYYACIY
jgi:hypothetical protein